MEKVTKFISRLVEHLQEPKWFNHILEETALRHFFYDALEPHFRLMHECLLGALEVRRFRRARSLAG